MADGFPTLVSDDFPYIPIRLLVAGVSVEGSALLDTGFDGAVVLPGKFLDPDLIPDSHALWTLGDGSEVLAPAHLGVLRIGDIDPIDVVVTTIGNETLLGRAVSDRFRITLDHGMRLIIEP